MAPANAAQLVATAAWAAVADVVQGLRTLTQFRIDFLARPLLMQPLMGHGAFVARRNLVTSPNYWTAPSKIKKPICASCLGHIDLAEPRLGKGQSHSRVWHLACADMPSSTRLEQLPGWHETPEDRQGQALRLWQQRPGQAHHNSDEHGHGVSSAQDDARMAAVDSDSEMHDVDVVPNADVAGKPSRDIKDVGGRVSPPVEMISARITLKN